VQKKGITYFKWDVILNIIAFTFPKIEVEQNRIEKNTER
jgi:hypothetical protein